MAPTGAGVGDLTSIATAVVAEAAAGDADLDISAVIRRHTQERGGPAK